MGPVRHLFLLMLLLLGACSLRTAVDAFSTEQDRAFAQEMVSRLRGGDHDWLERHFEPELWAQSTRHMGFVPGRFPREAGTTELIGFSISTNFVNGQTQRTKQFILTTHGGDQWAITSFQTYSTGGTDRVVQWSVMPHSSRPPEVAMIETWDSALPWFWGGMAITLCGIGGLIFWLVRRSRQKNA